MEATVQNRGGLIVQDPNNLRPAIKFSAIRGDAASDLFLVADQEQKLPPVVDNLSQLTDWRNYNNHANTCTPAAWAHQRHLVSSKLGTQTEYPTYQEVLELYKTGNSEKDDSEVTVKDANANVNFYLPSDHGMLLQSMLEELHKTTVPGRAKPVFFARVESPTVENISEAIAIFGSVLLGISVLRNNFNNDDNSNNQFNANETWTAPENPVFNFRHTVLAGGYDLSTKTVKGVSWGKIITLSEQWWNTKVSFMGNDTPVVHEAWIVVWPEHIGTRFFELGVNSERLKAEYKHLTGQDLTIP